MEKEEQEKEIPMKEESSVDSSIFLKIAEELKKDTENIGKKQSSKTELEPVQDKKEDKKEKIEEKSKIESNKDKNKIKNKSFFSRVPNLFKRKKEKIKEKLKLKSQEKPAEIIQPKKEIVKVIIRKQPDKQQRIVIKEVPKLRNKINNLRRSFVITANELKSKLGAVNFHQDAEIEFLKREADDLNKVIPFLIERIDAIEEHSNLIRNSASRKILKLNKEVKKNQAPLKRIVEEEKLLDEKIDKNTLRFNEKLLQEMAESKRMIEEEKYELKKHLFDTLAASIDDLTHKKEEADKAILSEIEKLREKIDEGDKNVNESLVSKIVQLRHKLNESKLELQEEITNELEELRKTVERRVERKVEKKIEEQKQTLEEDFKRFKPVKEREIEIVREVPEIKPIRTLEIKEIREFKEVPQFNSFSSFNETKPIVNKSPFYDSIKNESLKNKVKPPVKLEKSDMDFSMLPELTPLPFEKPQFFNPNQKFTKEEKIPIEKKIKKEIKESFKEKPLKLIKRKVPNVLYLEEPVVKELVRELDNFKSFSREGEQYFSKELLVKKEVHQKNTLHLDNECKDITKNLTAIRSLFSKIKEQ